MDMRPVKEKQGDNEGKKHFHKTGKVIAVDPWTDRGCARSRSEPVNRIGRCEFLDDGDNGDDRAKNGDDGDCFFKSVYVVQQLNGYEVEETVRAESQEFQ